MRDQRVEVQTEGDVLLSLPFPAFSSPLLWLNGDDAVSPLCRFLVQTGMNNRSPDKGRCIFGPSPPPRGMAACDVSISAVTNRLSAKANRQKPLVS